MIARIAVEARIAHLHDHRSLRQNGNCLFSLLAIVAAPAILAFEIEQISKIVVIYNCVTRFSNGNRLSINFSDRGLFFNAMPLSSVSVF